MEIEKIKRLEGKGDVELLLTNGFKYKGKINKVICFSVEFITAENELIAIGVDRIVDVVSGLDKFKLEKNMFDVIGAKVLYKGLYKKNGFDIKFVVLKYFAHGWVVKVEPSNKYCTFDEIVVVGTKVPVVTAMDMIDCSDEWFLERYQL